MNISLLRLLRALREVFGYSPSINGTHILAKCLPSPESWARNSKHLQRALLLAALLASGGCTAGETQIFVGIDAAPEGQGLVARTIEEAVALVRQDALSRSSAHDYRIILPEGIFSIARRISIVDLQLPPHLRLIIAGAATGGTRLSGGFAAERYLKKAPSEIGQHRYVLHLSDLPAERGLPLAHKLASASPQTIRVRVNHKKTLWPSRWPADGFVRVLETVPAERHDQAALSLAGLSVDLKNSVPGLWLGGYLTDSYLFVHSRVDALDKQMRPVIEKARLRIDGAPPSRVYLYNIKSFAACDAFYYDPLARLLAFCTTEPIETLNIATVDTLFEIVRSRNVEVSGLLLEFSTDDMIVVRDSSNIRLLNLSLRYSGDDGIALSESTRSEIRRVTVADTGGTAIIASGGQRDTLVPAGNLIEDCLLTDFSQIRRTFAPAIQVDGVGIAVRRNLIFNGPQSAVIFSGNDHILEENWMIQLSTESGDSGFIYTARDFTSQGNVIRRNVLVGTGIREAYEARGIYLDEFSSGNLVEGNAIVSVPYGILLNGGKDNRLVDNLFMFGTPSIWASALGYAPWWQKWRESHMTVPNGLTVKNLYTLPVTGEIWTRRYPHLASYLTSDLLKPERNEIAGNTFLGGGMVIASDMNIPTARLTNNRPVLYSGGLQVPELLSAKVRLQDAPHLLDLVAAELGRHGLNFELPQAARTAGSSLSHE